MSQAAARDAISQHLEVSDTAFFSCIWKDFILSDILFTSLLHKWCRHLIVCLDALLQQVVRQVWVRNDGPGERLRLEMSKPAPQGDSLAFPSLEFLFVEISKSQMLSKHLYNGHWESVWAAEVFVIPVWSPWLVCPISSGTQSALKRGLNLERVLNPFKEGFSCRTEPVWSCSSFPTSFIWGSIPHWFLQMLYCTDSVVSQMWPMCYREGNNRKMG